MNLILTFDYELFGDGSGDVFKHMIEPTEQIFNICDTYDIKTTLFFEVVEYWRLKEQWDQGNTMGYHRNPIEAIENQLQRAADQGHDIQLHLHPQWVDAVWEGGSWKMDMNNWRLSDFSVDEDYTIDDLLRNGKKTIEELIQPIKPDYECVVLRAGAYNIVPSTEIFHGMKRVGLKVDSSIYPYGYEAGGLSKFDYRNVELNKDYWWVDSKDMTMEARDKSEIMEIPVFALPQRRINKLLNIVKFKTLLNRRGKAFSSVAKSKISDRSMLEKIKFLFGKEAFTWDFCLFDKKLHKRFFNYIEKDLIGERDTFVLIGHPKSYQTDYSLVSMILLAQKSKYNYSFKTLRDVYTNFKTA